MTQRHDAHAKGKFSFTSPRSTRRPIAELLQESPFRIATSMISDHVAVVTLANPLPPLGPIVHDALSHEALRLIRETPAKGPISAIEVWSPAVTGAKPTFAYREVLDKPLALSLQPLGNGNGVMRRYLVSRTLAFENRAKALKAHHPTRFTKDGISRFFRTLFIPRPLDERLTARSVDGTVSLPLFIETILHEAGFSTRRLRENEKVTDFEAAFQEARILVRCFECETKVPTSMVDRFGYDFLLSRYDEGLFVSDGVLSYGVRHWERDRRIHLVGRLGLQRLINAVTARIIKRASDNNVS